MLKRCFDIFFSFIGLLLLLPLLLIIALCIVLTSPGGVVYKQVRVGKDDRDFYLFKFRTMRPGSDQKGLLTVGARDNRITRVGYFLRKFKLDELPQLFNVLNGTMSLVGPRPEVRKYVNLYTPEQRLVLSVRPGITDYASIRYVNENELLAKAADPEALYISEVMPAKLQMNLGYIRSQSLATDIGILFRTLLTVFGRAAR